MSYNENTRLNVSYLPWNFIQVHTSSVITSHCVKSWHRAHHLLRLRYFRDCSSPELDGYLYNCMRYGSSSHLQLICSCANLVGFESTGGSSHQVNPAPCWSDMTWSSKFILSLSGVRHTLQDITWKNKCWKHINK